MNCISFGDVWRINRFATHNFPTFLFLVHLTVVTVWFGDKTPADCQAEPNLFPLFTGYWILQCIVVLVFEFWVHWKWLARSQDGSEIHHASPFFSRFAFFMGSAISAAIYFIGASFMRLRPFACFYDSFGQRIMGPVFVWLLYTCYFLGSLLMVCFQKQKHRESVDPELTSESKINTLLPESLAYLELLLRVVVASVRDKFPLFTLLLHYTIILVCYGGNAENCDGVDIRPFMAYLIILMCHRFAFAFLREYVTKHLTSLSLPPKTTWIQVGQAIVDAIQSTALLTALIFNRSYPLRCVGDNGVAIVYSVSIYLLWISLAWISVTVYLQIRQCSKPQLIYLLAAKDASKVQ
jgi:hypothetical protein